MQKPQYDFTPLFSMVMESITFTAVLNGLRLGVFEAVAKSPRQASPLAEELGLQPQALQSLLELLAANGLLTEDAGEFSITPLAQEFLVASSPFFQGQFLELHNMFNVFIESDMAALLRGDASKRQVTDDSWSDHDNMRGTMQHALLGELQDTVALIMDLPGFSGMRVMCDVGGNHGEFSMALLEANPDLRAELMDLPRVAEVATERIAERGFSDRMTAHACDLRTETLPVDHYDLVLASHILYGFTDQLESFLGVIHDSLRSGGWFVAQHMDPASALPGTVKASINLITRLAGYKAHFIGQEQLEKALQSAGFGEFRTGPAGIGESGLVMAARKK
ncbi:MAG: methyltransferase domain-containing protein [Desulfovibrio sp.]|nr:MAG: methyltransferase domain-containing protein [Desulfovibrio sp.]